MVIDEGNTAAENGIEGSVSFVEKKNLGTVITKQLLELEDTHEPTQAVKKCKDFCSNTKTLLNLLLSLWYP